jgi:YggT family protein
MLSFGFPNIFGLLIISIADTIELILVTLVFAIFIQWLVSLLQPESPINQLLNKLTWPIMRPLQRVIPRIGGLDWSWVPAMIALFLIIIIVVQPLKAIGLGIAIG